MNTANAFRKFLRKALFLCLLSAAAAGLLPLETASAQDTGYVDLVMLYEYGAAGPGKNEVVYEVRNNGTATATGVTVSFLLEDMEADDSDLGSSIRDKRTVNTTDQRFTVEVGTIPPGGGPRIESFSTTLHSGIPALSAGQYRIGAITATASSIQPEPDILLANNVVKVYSFANRHAPSASLHMKVNRLALLLSVDDLRPDAGGDVDFGLTAQHGGAAGGAADINAIADIDIKVELSDGLEFKSGWNPSGVTVAPDRQSATWRPALVARSITFSSVPVHREIEIETQLTSDSLEKIPREERCITAWVEDSKPPPSPDYVLDSLKQCLGDDPPLLFTKGSLGILAPFPCIGDVNHICRDQNNDNTSDSEVVVAAVVPLQDETVNLDGPKVVEFPLRSQGIGRTDNDFRGISGANYFLPEAVVIQVKDPEGRVNDTYSHSLSSSGPTWQTGRQTTGRSDESGAANRSVSGVLVTYTKKAFNEQISNWTSMDRKLSVTYKNGDPVTGGIRMRSNSTGKTFLTTNPQNTKTTSLSSTSTSVVPYFFEFPTLGTYTVGFIAEATHTDAKVYSDTGSYTIHVGPIAELEVRDGGASPHAPADRNALTVLAINNGPDSSLGARVTGLPTGAEVLHISQGSYDGTKGEWNTGELEDSHLLRARRFPEHATLVLDADAGDTANVTIKNSVDYTVCIGSDASTLAHTTETACGAVTGASWHEGTVYDYNDDNNTATITAARGTGGVGPGIPGNPRAQTGATGVMWEEVDYLYGLPVERYEVQWLGSTWTTLDRLVAGNRYVDAAPSGRRDYRVRAVNMAGAAGPWSRSTGQTAAGHAGPPVNLRTEADGNNAIDVSWDAPEDAGGSAITGYTVQWSLDGTGGWSNAGSTADQAFKHRGLQTGAVRWYRVAARNRSGLGLWSDPVMGQTVSGTPDAPTLRATTLSDYEIELTWNEPKDNGDPISGYQIDYSSDGSAGSWQPLAEAGADPTEYVDSSLPANTRRYYRVRAVNNVGSGAWSRAVSAITQLTPPDAPSLTGVDADGPNAIVVAWQEPFHLGDLPITQYQVQWAKNQYSEIWRGPTTLSGSTLSWRHTGLKPDETWYYQVRASNGGNRWSVWSYIGAATTASDDAPKAVSGFNAQFDKDSYQVNLTWNDLVGGDATIQYELEHSEDGGGWRALSSGVSCEAGKCASADTDLWPGGKLSYRIRAVVNREHNGPWSGVKTLTVPPDPPDGPRYLDVSSDGSNHMVLEWEPPHYDGGAAVTGYRLLWCRALEGADENPCLDAMVESNSLADPPGYSRISIGASARSYTHSVSPGYEYFYLMRATNGGNRWSEWSEYDIWGWNRTYAGVPAAPGLTAQAVDANQIKLTWTKPNSYNSEISEYWLYVYEDKEKLLDFDNIQDIFRVPGDRTEWTVGGLSPETTRYFRIRALNDEGEGKYSALRQATTPDN